MPMLGYLSLIVFRRALIVNLASSDSLGLVDHGTFLIKFLDAAGFQLRQSFEAIR